jgi:glucose-6-phosphate isomerase
LASSGRTAGNFDTYVAMIEIKKPKSLDATNKPINTELWLSHWNQFLKKPEAEFVRINEPKPEQDQLWTAIRERASQIQAKRVLIVGIGGSSLGTQMIEQALSKGPGGKSSREFIYLEVPDSRQWLELKGTLTGQEHVLLISKSGETLETLTWMERLYASFPQLLDASHCTVISSPGEGPLQKFAKQNQLVNLTLPKAIGGRFSVLSAVGMLPAALMDIDIDAIRKGAHWASQRPELAAQLAGAALDSWKRNETITQLWTFASCLKAHGEWWQQLWSESLGKKGVLASSPMSCLGPRDQHSQVQQLLEGQRDKFVIIMRVNELESHTDGFKAQLFSQLPFHGRETSLGEVLKAQAQAFEKSLTEVSVSNMTLHLESLTATHLGALIMLWEMVIAMMGESLKINAFNQPGVELGKIYAKELLK